MLYSSSEVNELFLSQIRLNKTNELVHFHTKGYIFCNCYVKLREQEVGEHFYC